MRKFCSMAFVLVTACATFSVDEGLDRVRPGMDKAAVLELADGPKHTYHEKSQDHWIYEYYVGDRLMTRHLVFENSHVVSVLPARLKSARAAGADADDSGAPGDDGMEKYEKDVHELQKKHESEFEKVP